MLRFKRLIPNITHSLNNYVRVPVSVRVLVPVPVHRYLSSFTQFDINKPISINDINTSSVPNSLPNIKTTNTHVINTCTTPITINHTTNLKRKMPLAESIKNNHVASISAVVAIDLAYWSLTCDQTRFGFDFLFSWIGFIGIYMLCKSLVEVGADISEMNARKYIPKHDAKYDKPILVIDDWDGTAPYLRILSMLRHHTHIILSSIDTNKSFEKNHELLHNIKIFVSNTDDVPGFKLPDSHTQYKILNIQYLKYLNLEQRTRLIDWYVRKKIDIYENPEYNRGMCITSVNYDPNKIYDSTFGLNTTSYIEELHKEYTGECYFGTKIIDDSESIYSCTTNSVFDENSVDKEKSRVILVDFLDEYFNLTNVTDNDICKKLYSFGHYNIVAVERADGKMKDIFNESRKYALCSHEDFTKEMLFFVKSSYMSCCIDNLIFEMGLGLTQEFVPYVTFLDPRLKELYKGKYPIVELDVEKSKVDYSKIKVMDTPSFSAGQTYAITGNKKYYYSPTLYKPNEWYTGNLYGQIYYNNT